MLEIFPHLTPDPALVYSLQRDPIQGDVREVTTFRNPTINWAIYNIKAEWQVDEPSVKLVAGPESPPHSIATIPPLTKQLSLNEPLPAERRFKAYLISDRSFLVLSYSFTAAILQVNSFGSYFQPIEPLTENSWSSRVYKSYALLIAGVVGSACFVFLFDKGLKKIGGRLT